MVRYLYLMFISLSLSNANEYFTEISLSKDLFGISYDNANFNQNIETSSMYYFDFSLGNKIILTSDFSLEPSIGITGGESQNDGANYVGYNFIFPLMHQKKGFSFGSFMKYMYVSNFDNNEIILHDKNAYSLGAKIILEGSMQWFLTYEYVLNSNYATMNSYNNESINVNLEGSRIAIGNRYKF